MSVATASRHSGAPSITPPGPAKHTRWWMPAAAAALFVVWQIVLAPAAPWYPDTARYAAAAWERQGVPAEVAEQRAAAMLCADRAEQADREHRAQTLPLSTPPDLPALEGSCRAGLVEHLEPTDDPRYTAIFDTRPGYPAAVAAVEPLLGMTGALWAVAVGSTAAAGVAVWALLLLLGASPRAALTGQVVLYASPAGWWGGQLLTEGPVLLGAAAAWCWGGQLLTEGPVLLGAAAAWCGWVACVRGRAGLGVPLLVVGLGVLAATKYSTALPVAGALAVAAVLSVRRQGLAGVVAAGVVCGAVAAALFVVSRAAGWPGLGDTAQDLFTVHYALPDVADVELRLVDANVAYWSRWPVLTPANTALLAALLVGGGALWRWNRAAAWSAGAVLAAAAALTAAHPDVLEGDRLYVLAWLPAAVAVAAVLRGSGQTFTPESATARPTSSMTRSSGHPAEPNVW